MEQSQAPASGTGTRMIYVQGEGFIPLGPGQTEQQAVEIARMKREGQQPGLSDRAPLTLAGPGGQRTGGLAIPTPGDMSEQSAAMLGPQVMQMIKSVPQLGAFLAQLHPAGRALGMAGSVGIPAAITGVTSAAEGKGGWDIAKDVGWDAAIGGALGMPAAVGSRMTNVTGPDMVKKALFSTRAPGTVDRAMESALPQLALDNRASASLHGVGNAQRNAFDASAAATKLNTAAAGAKPGATGPWADAAEATSHATNMETLADLLEEIRNVSSIKKSGNAMTSVLPGAGPVTTFARAAQLPAAVGQAASPAIAAAKGNPARRLAIGRNLHRPANLATSETLGHGTSQAMRLLQVLNEAASEPQQPKRRRSR